MREVLQIQIEEGILGKKTFPIFVSFFKKNKKTQRSTRNFTVGEIE